MPFRKVYNVFINYYLFTSIKLKYLQYYKPYLILFIGNFLKLLFYAIFIIKFFYTSFVGEYTKKGKKDILL